MNSAIAKSFAQQVHWQRREKKNTVRIEDPRLNNGAVSHGALFSFSGEDCEAVGGNELSCSGNVRAEDEEVCVCACLCRCKEDR